MAELSQKGEKQALSMCHSNGMVCDATGTVDMAMAVEGCAISGMEVCDVEAFAIVPLGVYSSPESELS